jgi:hypothetical protein
MDTEEMYQRGYADAQRGEVHPFYYQHYYHYRCGYDHGRRRLGLAPSWRRSWSWGSFALLAALLLVAGGGIVFLMRPRPQSSPAVLATRSTPLAPVTALPVPTSTRPPLFPTVTPTPAPLTLRPGGRAVVSPVVSSGLRARRDPDLSSPVQATFKAGTLVTILEGPIQADGYVWWRVEGPAGAGWCAQGSLEGVIWIEPAE